MKAKIIISSAIMLLPFLTLQAGKSNQAIKHPQQILVQKASQDFGYFRVHRMGRDASLNWGVTNTEVDYFVIERSWDGSFFQTISEVSGTGEATYKFRDESCFPGYIYYRITAHNSDGTTTTSAVELLHMVAKK